MIMLLVIRLGFHTNRNTARWLRHPIDVRMLSARTLRMLVAPAQTVHNQLGQGLYMVA